MQQLRGVMQRYQASVEDILNRDQREQLETLQAQQRRQPSSNTRPNLVAQLNLSRDQANRIDDLEARMAEDLRAILTPSQLQQAQQLGLPGL
jgi:DNA-directed RNA polymerase subunit F